MPWNYRIVRYREHPEAGSLPDESIQAYGLHEVFYNSQGEAYAMTAQPCSFASDYFDDTGATPITDIIASLERALRDAKNRPVFDEPEVWAEHDPAPPEDDEDI